MIFAVAIQAAVLAPPPKPPKADTVTYVVKRKDTLDRFSRSFLVPDRNWKALLGIARIRDPKRLPVGRVLTIPRSWLRYTIEPAQLASYRGTVSISLAGRAKPLRAGLTVDEGTQIATGANSFATLILIDRSKVVIPSQSRVTVKQLRRLVLNGSLEYLIQVDQGRLETKVTPLGDPSGRYRIGTPISMTAVRGTEFRVTFDATGQTAAAEVLTGTVAVSPSSGDDEVLVGSALGASTDAKGETRIEKLLPAPDLLDPGKVQIKDEVTFSLTPVQGAARYRVVLASDAGFVENYAEQIVEGRDFTLGDVPNGNQFVRVSAIAASGLEGLAQSYSFSRRLASIRAEASQEEDGFRFRWFGAGQGTRRYRFQLMQGAAESRPAVDEVGLSSDQLTLRNLQPGVYYWRVGLLQIDESGEIESWTDPEKLTIAGRPKHKGK